MKTFLHFIAELRSNKKMKYEDKMVVLQSIIKSQDEFYNNFLATVSTAAIVLSKSSYDKASVINQVSNALGAI